MDKTIKDVDNYIAMAPKGVGAKLSQIRAIVKSIAPDASEGISYKIPFYKYRGALVGFAAFKNHISLFVPPPVIEEYKRELKGFETAKATIHFPLDKPLPITLIKKLIKARMKKNKAKKKTE
jgi:uncharacterized protein YdhG (YjbR/CyaY superfamily)